MAEGQEEQAAPAVATIQARLPEVRPGGAIELRLSVELLGPGRRELASHERPLWLLSDNPFVDRGRWLEGLKIGLFDPPGRTAAKLRAMGVPFEPIHNLAAIEEHEAKLLVIGEGLSFGRNRPLGEILIRWAEAGGKALCLAPSDGWLTLPGLAPGIEPRRRPQRIVLRGTDVIPELDKRLDALAWPPDGPIVASSLAVAAERNRLEFHVVDDESGWPWVESHYANGGSMLVCGFAIIERWDTGPTPRYLFARMLEEIAEPH